MSRTKRWSSGFSIRLISASTGRAIGWTWFGLPRRMVNEWNHEIRDAWRYRDYLIRAFNEDVPYDQLVREHIAGDSLEIPRLNGKLGINESIIGTAFWRFGELGHDNCVDFPEIRFDALDNQIDTFSKAFQGLTVSCARCHDHKLDAISTKDYYALVGMLENCSQVVHTLDSPERIAGAASEIRQLKVALRQQLGETWLAAIEPMSGTILAALAGETTLLTSASPGPRESGVCVEAVCEAEAQRPCGASVGEVDLGTPRAQTRMNRIPCRFTFASCSIWTSCQRRRRSMPLPTTGSFLTSTVTVWA